jgi:hypothetical protein
MKENIISEILDVLHWVSWADYIGYIGLTPHVGTKCGTIPIYSNNDDIETFIFGQRHQGRDDVAAME